MILSQEEERKKLLKEALKAELRSAAKDLLEEIALAERKLFCEQNEDVCNGYYSRGLDGLFGKIDVRGPRTSILPNSLQKILQKLDAVSVRGHEIGLHTSYNSFRSADQVKKEFERLISVAEKRGDLPGRLGRKAALPALGGSDDVAGGGGSRARLRQHIDLCGSRRISLRSVF